MQVKWLLLGIGLVAAAGTAVSAQQGGLPPGMLEKLKTIIVDTDVNMVIEKPDHDRLAVRRLDIVDEKGVIRMTLAAGSTQGVLEGIAYKRAFPVSGITLYDENGSERGGLGVADVPGSAVVVASDHANHDAIGWQVRPDGSVSFAMNGREPMIREPALGNRLVYGLNAKSRLSMNLAADGTPSLELADKEGRARIRLVTGVGGAGEIQFLNEAGKVVQTLSAEGLVGIKPN